jgi:hypothetical protein
MKIIELSRDEFLQSAQSIEDYKSLTFSKHCLDWWDDYFSWTKFPPLCLINDEEDHLCYLFYSISKENEYLTIHNLLTPKANRFSGYAKEILSHLFQKLSNKNIKRFKMYCVSSSLPFYSKLGLEYLGINDLGQYYCDFKMPKNSIEEIPKIVAKSNLDEIDNTVLLQIYEKLKHNGKQLDDKKLAIFEDSLEILQEKYHFDALCKRVESINKGL